RHTRFSRDWSSDVCSSDLRWSRSCGPRRPGPCGRRRGNPPPPPAAAPASGTIPAGTLPGTRRFAPPRAEAPPRPPTPPPAPPPAPAALGGPPSAGAAPNVSRTLPPSTITRRGASRNARFVPALGEGDRGWFVPALAEDG